jgi:hypothetical protein
LQLAQDALINHEAQQRTAQGARGRGDTHGENTEHIPKYGNGTTGIGNMREQEPEAKNQQALSYA